MRDKEDCPKLAGLRSLEASLHLHRCAEAARAASARERTPAGAATSSRKPGLHRVVRTAAVGALRLHGATARLLRRRSVRIGLLATGGTALTVLAVAGGLWLRLGSGPIPLDIATPWLTAAIADNLGDRYKVEVGGTVIELDENRRMAVRVRDVVVRDTDGTVVATAPKAEAGFTAFSLLTGHPRAESINLVGAEIALRVETDGTVRVFAGADKRPIATSPVIASADDATVELPPNAAAPASSAPSSASPSGAPSAAAPVGAAPAGTPATAATHARTVGENVAALLAWIDSLGTLGLDGGALAEVGLKSGNLVVDDARNGRHSRFENIHLSMTRPHPGELSVTLGSQDPKRPWVVVGAVKPAPDGTRSVRIEARKVALHDLLMAARADSGTMRTDLPVSASLRADIGTDGTPQVAGGRVLVGPGEIVDTADPRNRIAVDRFEATLEWDAARGIVLSPFQLVSGSTRMTLIAQAEVPSEPGAPWRLGVRGGSVVLGAGHKDAKPLLINRVLIRGAFDPTTRRLDIEHGEASGGDVNVAMSGFVDFATADPKLAVGMAARNLSATSFKRMWPPFVNPPVREWVMENMAGGSIDRIEIATNAPMSTLRDGGPPVPDDGLSIEVATTGTRVRLVDMLPEIRESDLLLRVRGRRITVGLGHGVAELPSGRRMTVSNGVFEVPDSQGKPPAATVRAKVDGPAAAAAEFLGLEGIRETAGAPLDPTQVRGTVTAQVQVSTTLESDPPPEKFGYEVTADLTNFSADKFAMSQKVEAQTLRVTADKQGWQLDGNVRIAGVPAAVEYHKAADQNAAEVRLTATIDDAARNKLGFAADGGLSGPVPVRVAGRMPVGDGEDSRFAVEADLTHAKIDNLLPSWVKPAGKPARVGFTYVGRGKAARFEDVAIEGSGAAVKGTVELDGEGDLASANFPVFGLSDGDKATLKVDRAQDGMLTVAVRGDVYDGRALIKSVMGGSSTGHKQREAATDVSLDLKIGALAGFNGEALRAVDLDIVRRRGRVEAFKLAAKIGVDQTLTGDLRGRVGGGGQVIYLESNDAGALFRFTDTYARMFGGQMWVAMDPPNADTKPKEGLLNVRDFAVRGEPSLDRVAAGAPGAGNPGVEFSRMRVEFVKSAGRLTIRDGVVRGPVIGATLEGTIDYAANAVRMRGTFVPLYGLNNAFGQIPIVGLFLGGGDKEGLVGVTYEVVGTPGAPMLRVNPISAVAPGVLRKFFEFPSALSGGHVTPPADIRSAVQ